MRIIPLNARLAYDADQTAEVEIVLFRIDHAQLTKPVRLSTDPTTRLSVEPLVYGTRSAWNNPDADPYLFALLSAVVPGDDEGTPLAAQMIIENVSADIGKQVRQLSGRPTLDMAVVTSSKPDQPLFQVVGLELVQIEGDAGQITLSFSREPMTSEPWPSGRFTRDRFPSLHP